MKKNHLKANVKSSFLLLAAILFTSSLFGQEVNFEKVQNLSHPRLLLLENEEIKVVKGFKSDTQLSKVNKKIIGDCNEILNTSPVVHAKIGKRLLDKSREALRRIFYLSYAWRTTKDQRYLQRAEKELLAVSGFSDWNPTHFLDVAEMTLAASVGYDWLYSGLSDQSRKIIEQAILEKGLKQSLIKGYNGFLTSDNNWNQVCNAGMLFGALAIYETNQELAKEIIKRSITSVQLSMKGYGPDGAYPEGHSYWSYGTSFNILLIAALEKVFGQDFNLSQAPGFLKTAGYYLHMAGPAGLSFNYSDARTTGVEPAMFWFANKVGDRSLLFAERDKMNNPRIFGGELSRILPALMVWNENKPLASLPVPDQNMWFGVGKTPVALMRTSWGDPNAIYLGFKGGSAAVSHAHMDIGSFVVDADGERWAMDAGMQDYESLESKGLSIFGRSQDAQRWQIFRMNNHMHNTLTISGKLQNVKGYAELKEIGNSNDLRMASADLKEIYPDDLKSGIRYAGIIADKYVQIKDSLIISSPGKIRWNMLTPAKVSVKDNEVLLTKNGKEMVMVVKGIPVKWKTWSTEPPRDFDAPNPGTTFVGFEIDAAANQNLNYAVYLVPVRNLKYFRSKVK